MLKTFFITAVAVAVAHAVQAQSPKYLAAMKQNVTAVDTAHTLDALTDLGNRFERIAEAEKTQGLPYYYAAYCQVMTTFLGTDKSKADEIANKAEDLITKAESLGGVNSETWVIRSMIATAHMMVDPANRYMQYGTPQMEAIKKSEALDPTNPRPVYLEGQNKYYTPEAFGGGKAAAKPLLEKALAMFTTFTPASEIAPSWGKGSTEYFLSLCNQ